MRHSEEISPAEKRIRWINQLYTEHSHVCFSYKLRLARPVIHVAPLESLWGRWDPEIRTLTISEKLIENYPWETVIEILKHEMAHQFVTDICRSDEAHGPLFEDA